MYNEIIPKNWASQYIDAYWIQTNDSNERLNIIIPPDGCSDIIFSFRDDKCESIIIGCMTKPIEAQVEPSEMMIGIRFKTGCAASFYNTSMKELTDKKVLLKDVINFDGSEITPSIILSTRNQIPELLEKSLKKLFLENKFDRITYSAANLIQHHQGLRSIDDIACEMNISRRQLERKFIDYVGISPKLYSRIIRFRSVNKMIKTQKDNSLISMALDAGYYDQSHFCREYKEFSSVTPLKKTMSHFYNPFDNK